MGLKKLKKGSAKSIENFIEDVDHEFVPMLSKKVNISEWAVKLDTFANNFACLDQYDNIEALLSFYVNKDCFITFFAVLEEHRRKGLGSMLLDACIQKCKKEQNNKIKVETWLTNKQATELYLSKGFNKVEIKNDRIGDLTLVLEKKI